MKKLILLYGLFFVASLVIGWIDRFNNHPNIQLGYWGFIITILSYFVSQNLKEIKNLITIKFDLNRKLTLETVALSAITFFILKGYFGVIAYFKIDKVDYTKSIVQHGWPIWTAFVLTALLPGIFEEIAFRGIIYTNLKKYLARKDALIIQAACFSVLHLLPLIFISHFIMGLYLGWIRERTGSLVLCILIHITWNAYVIFEQISR